MKKLLIVYNTCGLSNREPIDKYIRCVHNLLNQEFKSCDIAFSCCMNNDITIDRLIKEFGNSVIYNLIDDRWTVNVTFNHTVQQCVIANGNYEGYVYIDSGVNISSNPHILSILYNKFKSGPYGMVTLQVSNDTGFPEWLHGFNPHADYIIPVGRACNLHAQLFSNDLYEQYLTKIIPDIFVAYCTESTFSFLNAAIKKKWLIVADIILDHDKGVDGATCGFDHQGARRCGWDNLFGGKSVLEFVNNLECRKAGMGYEELEHIMMHDPKCFDADGYAIHQQLKDLIIREWYLPPHILDYNKINHTFINK